jgi:tetratricopeptide (TPR) repeat protein
MKRRVLSIVLAFGCLMLGIMLLGRSRTAAPNKPDTVSYTTAEIPAGVANLSLQTQPAGASVMINGRLAGSTPVALANLPLGEYGVRLEKDGCQPVSFKVALGADGANLLRKMDALPTGSLTVDVKPEGSEVLLDGEIVGQTPLNLEHLATGTYDLLIRKTNYIPYGSRVDIVAGQRSTYSGIDLPDRVLGMLEGLQKTEPQTLSHYIDLAHYLFVNNNMDRAVDVFSQALEMMQAPLNFNAAGYPGRENMSDAEVAQEERMRKRDEERLLKELDKHKNWPGKDTREFRRRIEQAQELINVKNLPSWEWAERSARVYLNNANYDKAERIYTEHIAVAQNSPDLPKAYVALMELHLMKRDLKSAREVFDTFFPMFSDNAEAMRNCGEVFVNKHLERIINTKDREKLVEMAEKSLRRGVEITFDPKAKAQCEVDLGVALLNTGRPADAAAQFKAALESTNDPALREDRSISLASALRRSGKTREARDICEKLADSPRPATRQRVKIELLTIDNAERKK